MKAARATCRNHSTTAASWKCESCGACFCDECVVVKRTKFSRFEICPACEGRCVLFAQEEPRAKRSFLSLLPGVLSYPLRKDGWLLLVFGTVFFLILKVASMTPVYGLVPAVFGGGYLCAYMIKIIRSSAKGDEKLPDWPHLGDLWGDIVIPFFGVVFTLLCAFIPAAVYYFGLRTSSGGALSDLVFLALGCCGLAYIPMALVALTKFGLGAALNPIFVVISILKVFWQYLVACVVLTGLVGLRVVSAAYLARYGLLVAATVDGLVSFYFLIVEMRILGLIYYANEDRLGWFKGSH